jgi:hypothetical protein
VLTGLVRCWACRTVMTAGFRTGRARPIAAGASTPAASVRRRLTSLEAELLQLVEPVFWSVLGGDVAAHGLVDDDAAGAQLEADVARERRGLDVYLEAIEMADLDARIAAAGMRTRQERVQAAQAKLDDWRRGRAREQSTSRGCALIGPSSRRPRAATSSPV